MYSTITLSTLNFSLDNILLFLILILSLCIHEWAHAFCADKLGDPLPRSEGRVTLDPRVHIDPIGSLLLPIIMIFLHPGFMVMGWGKPVNISLPHPKTRYRDDILITIAGPLSNLFLALVSTFAFILTNQVLPLNESFLKLNLMIVHLNCLLFLFNLIPIPPLDGSHLLKRIFNIKQDQFNKFSPYGIIILLLLVNFEPFIETFYDFHSVLASQFSKIITYLS